MDTNAYVVCIFFFLSSSFVFIKISTFQIMGTSKIFIAEFDHCGLYNQLNWQNARYEMIFNSGSCVYASTQEFSLMYVHLHVLLQNGRII